MDFVSLLSTPEMWIAFFTLTALELVLGIDNIIFISIIVGKLPEPAATRARQYMPRDPAAGRGAQSGHRCDCARCGPYARFPGCPPPGTRRWFHPL